MFGPKGGFLFGETPEGRGDLLSLRPWGGGLHIWGNISRTLGALYLRGGVTGFISLPNEALCVIKHLRARQTISEKGVIKSLFFLLQCADAVTQFPFRETLLQRRMSRRVSGAMLRRRYNDIDYHFRF